MAPGLLWLDVERLCLFATGENIVGLPKGLLYKLRGTAKQDRELWSCSSRSASHGLIDCILAMLS